MLSMCVCVSVDGIFPSTWTENANALIHFKCIGAIEFWIVRFGSDTFPHTMKQQICRLEKQKTMIKSNLAVNVVHNVIVIMVSGRRGKCRSLYDCECVNNGWNNNGIRLCQTNIHIDWLSITGKIHFRCSNKYYWNWRRMSFSDISGDFVRKSSNMDWISEKLLVNIETNPKNNTYEFYKSQRIDVWKRIVIWLQVKRVMDDGEK